MRIDDSPEEGGEGERAAVMSGRSCFGRTVRTRSGFRECRTSGVEWHSGNWLGL